MKWLMILLLTTGILAGCSSERESTPEPRLDQDYPDQQSWDATLHITREAKTVGLLKAGHIKKFSEKKVTFLDDGIQVDFYNNEGHHTSVLTSQGGKVFDVQQDMIAYGNVVVESDSGATLYTDTLRWDNQKQQIFSDIPVMITTEENDTLYGDRFRSNPQLTDYEIINPRGKSSKRLKIE